MRRLRADCVEAGIADLYGRVQVGTRVVVLPGTPPGSVRQSSASLTVARSHRTAKRLSRRREG
jgi:hypothetical protein